MNHPFTWVVQLPSNDVNGEDGTIQAGEYAKGDTATFFVYEEEGGIADITTADKKVFERTLTKAISQKGGNMYQDFKVKKVTPSEAGKYMLCDFQYTLLTGAGFEVQRSGVASVTSVGPAIEALWAASTRVRYVPDLYYYDYSSLLIRRDFSRNLVFSFSNCFVFPSFRKLRLLLPRHASLTPIFSFSRTLFLSLSPFFPESITPHNFLVFGSYLSTYPIPSAVSLWHVFFMCTGILPPDPYYCILFFVTQIQENRIRLTDYCQFFPCVPGRGFIQGDCGK